MSWISDVNGKTRRAQKKAYNNKATKYVEVWVFLFFVFVLFLLFIVVCHLFLVALSPDNEPAHKKSTEINSIIFIHLDIFFYFVLHSDHILSCCFFSCHSSPILLLTSFFLLSFPFCVPYFRFVCFLAACFVGVFCVVIVFMWNSFILFYLSSLHQSIYSLGVAA